MVILYFAYHSSNKTKRLPDYLGSRLLIYFFHFIEISNAFTL